MKKKASWIRASIGVIAMSLAALSPARAEVVDAKPIGFEEVPSVLSPARATFKARINKAGTEIKWELKYSGIDSEVTQAHVHFGKARVNGGVMLFACSNLANPPTGTAACPKNEGTVTGTWTSENVLAVAAQGIEAGEDALAQVIAAIHSNSAYFNIHSKGFPGGELRDQVH